MESLQSSAATGDLELPIFPMRNWRCHSWRRRCGGFLRIDDWAFLVLVGALHTVPAAEAMAVGWLGDPTAAVCRLNLSAPIKARSSLGHEDALSDYLCHGIWSGVPRRVRRGGPHRADSGRAS